MKNGTIVEIPKAATGIAGLDEVLYGGLPERRVTLIKGSAGTGKTVLGLEFLYNAAANGRAAVFVTFEENAQIIRQNAMAMGWDIGALEKKGKFFLWGAKIDRSAVLSGEFTIDSLLAVIKGKAEQINAEIVMIDALDVLIRIFEDPVKERNEMYRLHDWLIKQNFTTILTAKVTDESENVYRYEFLDYMADCVILLDLRVVNQIATRRLRVMKYRGSAFFSNEYPYLITTGGSVIMPITATQLQHVPPVEKVSSGNDDLDEALDGGYFKGSSILISGPTGSGKTTLAATFAKNACDNGDKVLYISFEESEQAIISTMLCPGIDLREAVNKAGLVFHTLMPEALVVEEHLYKIYRLLDELKPHHIVLDSISACRRMGTREAAFDFLVRLTDTCKQRNITCLMTNQFEKTGTQAAISGVGLSSIVDSLIKLSFIEVDNELRRNLVIIKSRGAHHSNRHYIYKITDCGVRVTLVDTKKAEPNGD